MFALHTKVGPLRGHGAFGLTAIEKAHSFAAILQLFRPDFQQAILADPPSRLAEWILIHIDDFVITKQTKGEFIQPGHVAAEDQGSGQQAPE